MKETLMLQGENMDLFKFLFFIKRQTTQFKVCLVFAVKM